MSSAIAGSSRRSDLSVCRLLGAMSAAADRADCRVEQIETGALGIVAAGRSDLTGVYRLASRGDGFAAATAGSVYCAARERRRLESQGVRFETERDAELLLRGWLAEGRSFLRRIHGRFAAAIWDERAQRLHLVNDRFGLQPIYYVANEGRFAFATSLAALVPGLTTTQLSEVGVAQFFGFGQFFGDQTLYDEIRSLLPGAHLTFDAARGQTSIDRYWDLKDLFGDRSHARRSDALDRIDTALEMAVERCVADVDSLGLSLSAGLDSRSLLAMVPDRIPLSCVTLGMAGSVDRRLATRLADIASRPLSACVLDGAFLADYGRHFRAMVRLTDGHYVSGAIVMPSLALYPSIGIKVLLRGHGGELMHMDKAYAFSMPAKARRLAGAKFAEWLFQRIGSRVVRPPGAALFRSPYREAFEDAARASFKRYFAEAADAGPAIDQASYLFVRQYLHRSTALSLAKFGSVVDVRTPFIDPDFIAAVIAAPPELRYGDDIQTWLLRRRAPALARVANSNNGAPLGASLPRRMASHAMQRALGRLGLPGYQPYERLGLWLGRELQPFVRSILTGESCRDRGIYEPSEVARVLDDHVAGRANHTYLILALLAFEVGQRELTLDTDAMPMPAHTFV